MTFRNLVLVVAFNSMVFAAFTVAVPPVDTDPSNAIVLLGHEKYVPGIVFSPDGNRLYSAGWDKTVRLWDLLTAKQIGEFAGNVDKVTALDLSPDGSLLATGAEDRTVRVWDTHTFKELAKSSDLFRPTLAFSPDGLHLAVGTFEGTGI